jgi:pimeloyl-ACP methyl ester carboxylesterase
MAGSRKPAANGSAKKLANGNGVADASSESTQPTIVNDLQPLRNELASPRTLGFYGAAAVALLVYSITPLSWLTVGLRYYKTKELISVPVGGIAKTWYYLSLAEVVFSIYFQYLMWKGSQLLPPPTINSDSLSQLLTKCLMVGLTPEDMEKGDKKQGLTKLQSINIEKEEARILQNRLRIWFHHAALEDIYTDNVREWLSWAFAGRPLPEVKEDAEMSKLIDQGLEMIKHRLQWQDMREGFNPNVKAICLTIDKMKVISRPLGYYVVCNAVTHGTILFLRMFRGFHYEYSGQCSFLVKPPNKASTSTPKKERALPILFLHGLGIGLGQYMHFLGQLAKHEDGVVILVQPHISADITHRHFLNPPNKDEQADAVYHLLQRLNMPKVTTLSHSNGTMVLGWILRRHPEVCANNILVDPVSFRLWEGNVCFTFVYKKWDTMIDVLLGYFVARELGTARTIGRNFNWSDMCLWVDEFGEMNKDNLHFVFGESDLLVDVPSCVSYLKESGVPDECVTIIPKYQHGKALIFKAQGMKLVNELIGIPASKW